MSQEVVAYWLVSQEVVATVVVHHVVVFAQMQWILVSLECIQEEVVIGIICLIIILEINRFQIHPLSLFNNSLHSWLWHMNRCDD